MPEIPLAERRCERTVPGLDDVPASYHYLTCNKMIRHHIITAIFWATIAAFATSHINLFTLPCRSGNPVFTLGLVVLRPRRVEDSAFSTCTNSDHHSAEACDLTPHLAPLHVQDLERRVRVKDKDGRQDCGMGHSLSGYFRRNPSSRDGSRGGCQRPQVGDVSLRPSNL
jgi:hypothetical protein